jgi:cytoskeleton protein RodZ
MSPQDADITELPSSPGARLRREREAQGLTEQQAAESLNLDPTVIVTLEANDFTALGAPVFVKGHLRHYAMLLGLEPEEILAAYERSKSQIGEPTLVPKSRLEMAPVRGRPRWPWVVGGSVAFLLAAVLVAYLSENGGPWSDTHGDEEPAEFTANDPFAPIQRETAPATTTGTAGVADPAADGTAPPVTPGLSPDPATAAQATAPGASAGPPAPGPGQVNLQLRFSADSWVEIFDGTGKALVYELGQAGTERTLTATAPLSVTLGNASAVAILVNGRPVPPPPAQGAVARFRIGPDGSLR